MNMVIVLDTGPVGMITNPRDQKNEGQQKSCL